MTRKVAMSIIKDEFKEDRAMAAIMMKQMDLKSKELKWVRNINAFYKDEIDNSDTFVFDEEQKSDRDDIYHIISENGPENWNLEVYQSVFPNQKKENMVVLKDCSHFLHEEKPDEIRKYLGRILDNIDAREAATLTQSSEFEIKDLSQLPDPIKIDDDALSFDDATKTRDFKMVLEDRSDAPWFLEPFKEMDIVVFAQTYYLNVTGFKKLRGLYDKYT